MSIYDRSYMEERDESFGHVRGWRISAIALLIIINTIVWILWQIGRSNPPLYYFMQEHFIDGPVSVFRNLHIHTLLTATLSHIDLGHILFNMLGLWVFGSEVQAFYGNRNFLFLYVFCGVSASLLNDSFRFWTGDNTSHLGASGAVMGIAAVSAILSPNRPMLLMGVVPIAMKWLVGLYIILDLAGAAQQTDNVNHLAHLCGAAAGALFWALDLRPFAGPGRTGSSGLWQRVQRWFHRRRFRVVENGKSRRDEFPRDDSYETSRVAQPVRRSARSSASTEGQSASATHAVDAATARRVDELLAKISREGLGALNDEERAFLKASSEKYKR